MHTLCVKHNLNRVLFFGTRTHHSIVSVSANKSETNYQFDGDETITIVKENPWMPYDRVNTFVMMLYALNLFLCNMFDCDNLPFRIDICINTSHVVHLHDVAVSDSISIQLWSTAVIIQVSLVTVLIATVGMLLSMFIHILLGFPVLVVALIIAIRSIKLLRQMKKEMYTYIKT